jgi:hypothetical protein
MASGLPLVGTNWSQLNWGSKLTDGLCVLVTPAGEAISGTPWRLSDQNNISRAVSTRPGAPTRHVNYGFQHPMSSVIPSVIGAAGAGPPRILTSLAIQRQWRRITGDLTYLYLGYGANVTNSLAFWSLANEWGGAGSTNYAAQDYLPYSSFATIREFCIGGQGTADNGGTFNGLRIRFTNPAAGAPLILTRQGSTANVYVGQAENVTYSGTVTGSIGWGQYNSKDTPTLEGIDYTAAEFVAGALSWYDPFDTAPNYATAGVGIVAVWNRVLTSSERVAVYNDPTLLFEPTAEPLYRRGAVPLTPPASTFVPRTVWV